MCLHKTLGLFLAVKNQINAHERREFQHVKEKNTVTTLVNILRSTTTHDPWKHRVQVVEHERAAYRIQVGANCRVSEDIDGASRQCLTFGASPTIERRFTFVYDVRME